MITLPALAECLDVPEQHAEVRLILLAVKNMASLRPESMQYQHTGACRYHICSQRILSSYPRRASRCAHCKQSKRLLLVVPVPQHAYVYMHVCHSGQPKQVDIHAVALFFFAQLYLRQAQRPDTMDIWPSQASQDEKAFNSQLMPAHQQGQTQPHQPHHSPLQNGGQPGQQEPVSPARSNSSRSSAGSQGSPGKPFSLSSVMHGFIQGICSATQPFHSLVFIPKGTNRS